MSKKEKKPLYKSWPFYAIVIGIIGIINALTTMYHENNQVPEPPNAEVIQEENSEMDNDKDDKETNSK